MFSLPPENWLRLFVWLAIGFAIYFGYGRKRSVLARMRAEGRIAGAMSVPSPGV
jgi:APA family basic amino acid/polyamine antiporter